ncbi:MAG: spondin domain-containing protein [Thermoleophilia bacterium]|nr:spondin domain-containing protein [Thermoleophilia bacterium]MDH3724567.1 spondin domain-containing protein [Thermoleophilia bacterium]
MLPRSLAVGIATCAAALALPALAMGASKPLEYRITIKNLSKADLTPAVWGVHDRRANLFRRGRFASTGVSQLAEDGVTAIALAEFRRKKGVRRAAVSNRIAPGRSITLRVRTTTRHRRFSFASMQVCSNDTFAGVNKLALPLKSRRRVLDVRAYDAGTERNTESAAHVPCLGAHGVGPTERRRITRDPRIRGIADLRNSRHGWNRTIARMTIRRVK